MQIDVIETFMWSIMLESHVSPNSYRLNNKKIKNTLATGQYGLIQIDVIETFMLSITKGRLAAAIHSTSQKKQINILETDIRWQILLFCYVLHLSLSVIKMNFTVDSILPKFSHPLWNTVYTFASLVQSFNKKPIINGINNFTNK